MKEKFLLYCSVSLPLVSGTYLATSVKHRIVQLYRATCFRSDLLRIKSCLDLPKIKPCFTIPEDSCFLRLTDLTILFVFYKISIMQTLVIKTVQPSQQAYYQFTNK